MEDEIRGAAQECDKNGIQCAPELVDFLIDDLHTRHQTPLLPCHPRDLLGLALDHNRYLGREALDEEALRWAWDNYFVRPGA